MEAVAGSPRRGHPRHIEESRQGVGFSTEEGRESASVDPDDTLAQMWKVAVNLRDERPLRVKPEVRHNADHFTIVE